jgi:hypothetical protein
MTSKRQEYTSCLLNIRKIITDVWGEGYFFAAYFIVDWCGFTKEGNIIKHLLNCFILVNMASKASISRQEKSF